MILWRFNWSCWGWELSLRRFIARRWRVSIGPFCMAYYDNPSRRPEW